MKETTADLIDTYRRNAIDDFYSDERKSLDSTGHLSIQNRKTRQSYSYTLHEYPSLSELQKLASDPAASIYVSTEYGEYRMLADGTLTVLDLYE